jgi:hypothetical protein
MDEFAASRGRRIAAGFLLMALSAVPYATVYGIEAMFGAPHVWLSALAPTVAAPVLVAALLTVTLLRGRTPRAVTSPAFSTSRVA